MAKPKVPSNLEFHELRDGTWKVLVTPRTITIDKLKDLILEEARLPAILSMYNELLRYNLYQWETEVIDTHQQNEEIEVYKKTQQDHKVEPDNPDSDVYPVRDYIDYPTKPTMAEFDKTAHATLYRNNLKDIINKLAGEKRDEVVSQGSHIVEEYRIAANQAKDWLEAGSDQDDVPRGVKEWADIKGYSYEEAAHRIIATNEAWVNLILDIRQIRLQATEVFTQQDEDGQWVYDLDTCYQTRLEVERKLLLVKAPE